MGQQADAAGQIAGHRHLLTIEQGHLLPARPAPGNRRRETGVQIRRHREGHRQQLFARQLIALDHGVHQFAYRLADRLHRVGRGRGGAPQGAQGEPGAHGR